MKFNHILALVILVSTLFACGQNSATEEKSEAKPIVRHKMPTEPPLPPEGVTTLSDYGLGPIKRGTRFNQDSISSLLGGYEVKSTTAEFERGKFRIFEAYKGGKKVFEFYPDSRGEKISSIHLFTDDFEGPDGTRVGMTYRAVKGDQMNCFPGMEEQSGFALCFKGGNTRVQYIFSHDFTGPDSELPPPAVLGSTGVLKQIIWYAERK